MTDAEFVELVARGVRQGIRGISDDDREDLVQAALLELVPRRKTLEEKDSVYLRVSAKNAAIRVLREEKRKRLPTAPPIKSQDSETLLDPADLAAASSWSEDDFIIWLDEKAENETDPPAAVSLAWLYVPQFWDEVSRRRYGPKSPGPWATMKRDFNLRGFYRPVTDWPWLWDVEPSATTGRKRARIEKMRVAWVEAEQHVQFVDEERRKNAGAEYAVEELGRILGLAKIALRKSVVTPGMLRSWWVYVEPILGWCPMRTGMRLRARLDVDLGAEVEAAHDLPAVLREAINFVRVRWLPVSSLPHVEQRSDSKPHRDMIAEHLAGAGWEWTDVAQAMTRRPLEPLTGATTATLKASVLIHRQRISRTGGPTSMEVFLERRKAEGWVVSTLANGVVRMAPKTRAA